jgi:hypothetical protein
VGATGASRGSPSKTGYGYWCGVRTSGMACDSPPLCPLEAESIAFRWAGAMLPTLMRALICRYSPQGTYKGHFGPTTIVVNAVAVQRSDRGRDSVTRPLTSNFLVHCKGFDRAKRTARRGRSTAGQTVSGPQQPYSDGTVGHAR